MQLLGFAIIGGFKVLNREHSTSFRFLFLHFLHCCTVDDDSAEKGKEEKN